MLSIPVLPTFIGSFSYFYQIVFGYWYDWDPDVMIVTYVLGLCSHWYLHFRGAAKSMLSDGHLTAYQPARLKHVLSFSFHHEIAVTAESPAAAGAALLNGNRSGIRLGHECLHRRHRRGAGTDGGSVGCRAELTVSIGTGPSLTWNCAVPVLA